MFSWDDVCIKKGNILSRIIVVYRDEAEADALRLGSVLVQHFGVQAVTLGTANLVPPDVERGRAVEDRVRQADAVIVVIGPRFLDGAWVQDDSQIDRLMIRAAIEQDKWLIPVLADHATLPTSADLDEALRPLTRSAAFPLSETYFREDVAKLIRRLEDVVPVPPPAAPSQPVRPNPVGSTVTTSVGMPPPDRLNRASTSQTYEFAGIGARFFAILIDGIILAIIFVVIAAVLISAFGPRQPSVAQLVINLLSIVIQVEYDVYFLTRTGQTPGRQMMGIRVIKEDGRLLNTGEVIIREVGRVLSSFLLLGYLLALADSRRQTLHDKFAGSLVVRT